MLTDKQVRGKLVNQGVRSLSDAELLSILLQKGEAGGSALELAERLLEAYDHNLMRIALDGPGKLRSVAQLGIARAALVSAALEIGRRGRAAENSMRDQIMSDRDVIELFQPELAILPHEEFWVLYLNASNKILDRVRISQGGVTGTVVDYKLIVKRAVERLAQAHGKSDMEVMRFCQEGRQAKSVAHRTDYEEASGPTEIQWLPGISLDTDRLGKKRGSGVSPAHFW